MTTGEGAEMPENAREQRRFPRVPVEKAVLVKKAGDVASEALAKTRTVGGGGCMFVHDRPLGVGSRVELLISLPHRVVTVQGRVVWEVAKEPRCVEIGVEFVAISPKDRRALDEALLEQTPA